ncbi:hypothetical protein [Flavobacterium sp. Leaf359]|uniref:hypothetical protein n=1 Tax=Flavobacterium sp. Leaf359 TaxID=1736351 RepID=UPI000ABCD5C8|nr:hypothetical protein [Flavobacterium sp. Leaf359]
MKGLIIIILTFAVAFMTTFLLDLKVVSDNLARIILVWFLLVVEIAIGIYLLKALFRKQ